MIIGIPQEFFQNETRVSLVPESIAKFKKKGFEIQMQKGAGLSSGFTDAEYEKEGVKIIATAEELYESSDILVKLQRPEMHPSGKHELDMLKEGSTLIGFFYGLTYPQMAQKAAKNRIDIISMDAVPRTTKAQRMDALSSQTNLAGYKAVIIGANALGKIFPLMMTAAGTISPARVVIIGAGVAGLQAIATAKRLGAIVNVSDVRKGVKEQVESLGGKYIEPPSEEGEEQDSQATGGYAKEVTPEYLQKQQEVLARFIKEADLVITTANVPGRKAPVLINADIVYSMAPGAVIVDMAAESGGNCELTKVGETVEVNGVKIFGIVNLPAQVPFHASQLYSRNLLALIDYISEDGALKLDLEDEIVQGALLVHKGAVINEKIKELI